MTPVSNPARPGNAVLWGVAGLFAVVTAAKFLIVGHMDLFFDEATYWQASLRLDAGYTHTLAMTPLLIRAGTFIFGDTIFGVRVLFTLCSAAIPFAVYLLAYPMVGRRDAILAAGVTQIMPLTAVLGQAYMDPPMFLFTVLGLAAFERARRNDGIFAWLSLGAATALGIATHYRFAPFVLGLLAYLLITRRGRGLWRKPGLWIAGLVGAIGLVPVVYFNIETGFAGFKYQVLDRSPWAFQAKGLLFLLEQFAVVTPFLFIALMGTLFIAVKRALAGDDDHALLAIIGAVYIGFYLVLAPFSDLKREHIHWPAAGYFPLFVLLPGVLRAFAHGGASAMAAKARRFFRWMVPATGAAVVGVLLFFVGAWTWPSADIPDRFRYIVRHGLVNWSLSEPTVTRLLADNFAGSPGKVALVASNYKVGAELEYIIRPPGGVFVLDHLSNIHNGIAPQLTLWNIDEGSLRRTRPGADAFIVIDNRDHELSSVWKRGFRRNLCAVFNSLVYLGDFEFAPGRRRLHFYKGRVNPPNIPPPPKLRTGNCAVLPAAQVVRPRYGRKVRGMVPINGWATDDDFGIKKVEILVDGKVVGLARYGWRDPRVIKLLSASRDPNYPRVGYLYKWDSAGVGNGLHRISIRTHSANGKVRKFGRRAVFVDNP